MPNTNIFKLLLVLSFPIFLGAQTDDNILWTKLGVQKAISPQTTLLFAPIIRLNNDFSDYQNFSLDYTIRHKLNKGFTVQLTGRTWFLPNGTQRQFIWPDVLYKKKFEKWQLGSLLRLHYAADVKDVVDQDFLRWKTTFSLINLGKVQLDVGIEPWLRLNKVGQVQRVRIITGGKYKFSDQFSVSLHLWREKSVNLEPQRNTNIFVLGLAHVLKDREK